MLKRLYKSEGYQYQTRQVKALGQQLVESAVADDLDAIINIVSEYGDSSQIMNYRGTIDNDQATALLYAVAGGHTAIVNELIKAPGLDLNQTCEKFNGLTPLLLAIIMHRTQCAIALLKKSGIEINAVCKLGKTPMMYAVEKCPRVVPYLLASENFLITRRDKLCRTAVHYAAMIVPNEKKKQDLSIMPFLKLKNVEVDAQDYGGSTPLMYAAKAGNLQNVMELLQAGADVSIENRDGYTAYDLAKLFEKDSVAWYLEPRNNLGLHR